VLYTCAGIPRTCVTCATFHYTIIIIQHTSPWRAMSLLCNLTSDMTNVIMLYILSDLALNTSRLKISEGPSPCYANVMSDPRQRLRHKSTRGASALPLLAISYLGAAGTLPMPKEFLTKYARSVRNQQ